MENFGLEKINYERRDEMIPEITEDDVDLKSIRSSGPGGQRVNKASTCVQLRWSIQGCGKFNDEQKNVLFRELPKIGAKINQEGQVCLQASGERSHERNKQDVIARLNDYVRRALTPRKERQETKVPHGQKKKRLEEKRYRGQIKIDRQKVRF